LSINYVVLFLTKDEEIMAREGLLSVLDIAQELNTGKATTKFLLKRFKKWLPCDLIDGQAFYTPDETIKRLFIIQENLDMGKLPSNIEKILDIVCESDSDGQSNLFTGPNNTEDTHLESLFHDIIEQQKRIAIAQEKRVFTEEKKVAALNNIAKILQDMNTARTIDPAAQQIAHQVSTQAASSIAPAERIDDERIEDEIIQKDILVELDNLSALIDESDQGHEADVSMPIDDLSTLIDLKDDAPKTDTSIEIDDLSKLIDTSSDDDLPAENLDDLSQLIDDTPDSDDEESGLPQMDDMDDLAKLIDDTPEAAENLAVGNDEPEDESDNIPTITIDVSPEEDLGKYKAAVTKIIIGLKTEGLSVGDAANRLNKNKIQTLSGKPEWSQKAISQIYKFIESAK